MKMKKMGALAATLAAVAAFALAGCGATTGGNTAAKDGGSSAGAAAADDGGYTLVKDGTLTVATSPDFPPFENLENGEYVGFDIELAKALGKELGLKVEFKNIQFDGIVPAIAAGGQADVGMTGMTIEPDREKQVDFSDPYYVDDQAVATMKSNTQLTADNYEKELDKSGVVIAVQSGTTGETYAKEHFSNATVKSFGNATDCFAAMQSGQAVAVVTNKAMGEKMVGGSYTDAQVLAPIATGENYGIAVSKDNPALTSALNKALKKLTDDGTVEKLTNEYLLK